MAEPFSKITKEPFLSATRVRLVASIAAIIFTVLGVIWACGLVPGLNSPPRANSIMTIQPYRHNGTWVFDDLSAGLVQEPFIAGVPEMVDFLVRDVPNAETGFRMLFSAREFPGHQHRLDWVQAESGGNYYKLQDPEMEGWVCPAMYKYFKTPPSQLYVKAEAITQHK